MELVALMVIVAAIFELSISKQIRKSYLEIILFYVGVIALFFLSHPGRLIGFYILFTHQIIVISNRYRAKTIITGLAFLMYWMELFLTISIYFTYGLGLLVMIFALTISKKGTQAERFDVFIYTLFLVIIGPLQNYGLPFTGMSVVVVVSYRFYRNASLLRQSHDQFIQNTNFYESIVKYSPNSIILTDINGLIVFTNDSVTDLTGYSREEMIGMNPRIFKSNETPIEVYQELWHTILGGNIWQGTLKNRKKTGETYWETLSITPLFNSIGEISYFLATKNNSSDEVQRMSELENEAFYDGLTGAFRRKHFEQQVMNYRQINKTINHLIMMDVDDYKNINDTYGHQIGDVILENLSMLLHREFSTIGYVGRYGGDEFVVFVYDTTRTEVNRKIQIIRDELPKAPICIEGKTIEVSLSIGIHRMLMQDSIETALSKADVEMYKEKKSSD